MRSSPSLPASLWTVPPRGWKSSWFCVDTEQQVVHVLPTLPTVGREQYVGKADPTPLDRTWWTGLAPWEFEFPFPGSLIPTFLAYTLNDHRLLYRTLSHLEDAVVRPPSVSLGTVLPRGCNSTTMQQTGRNPSQGYLAHRKPQPP